MIKHVVCLIDTVYTMLCNPHIVMLVRFPKRLRDRFLFGNDQQSIQENDGPFLKVNVYGKHQYIVCSICQYNEL